MREILKARLETIEVVDIPSENITINYTCKYKHNGNLFGNTR